MVKDTQSILAEDYRQFTDKYFMRTRQILEKEGINPFVRYQVFSRKCERVAGVDKAVQFIKDTVGKNARVFALKDNDFYSSGEPLLKIEGNVQDLVELETVYLGIISSGLTGNIDMNEVRRRARDIVVSARHKPVFYFGARHFDYSLDEEIGRICKEEGFVGASTDIGARAWNSQGLGTTPHALVVSYAANLAEKRILANPTVEAAKGFDRHMDKSVPRIMLIDTFNREIQDSIETARAVPNLKGVRIDTCGENYAQGSQDVKLPKINVSEKYLSGKGVSISAVWALREALVRKNLGNLELTVSSGFNSEKIEAFMEADKVFRDKFGYDLFTNIGTGSISNPVMATSDIVAYRDDEGIWKELHKTGRPEVTTSRLQEVK